MRTATNGRDFLRLGAVYGLLVTERATETQRHRDTEKTYF